MLDDSKAELRHLKGALLYYESLISQHDKSVEEAAQKVTQAKADLAEILKKREEAPAIIESYRKRIKQTKIKVSCKPIAVDPNLAKVLRLREKLRQLEQDLSI